MGYRIADEEDFFELANMRWDFKMEGKDNKFYNYDKKEFLKECIDFFKQGNEDGTWTHWVATYRDTIISNISIHHIRKVPKPNRYIDEYGYVTNIYSKPEYRGQGIGSKLMDHVKDWAIKNDFEILIVWPSSKAVKFYEQKGFSNQNDIMELVIRPDI